MKKILICPTEILWANETTQIEIDILKTIFFNYEENFIDFLIKLKSEINHRS